MRRSAYAMLAACFLVVLPVNAQEGQEKQPLVPRRPLFKLEKQNTPPTVIEALKSLGAITVGDIRSMSDGDLRQLTDLLKQWIDIAAIEEKRREEARGPEQRDHSSLSLEPMVARGAVFVHGTSQHPELQDSSRSCNPAMLQFCHVSDRLLVHQTGL